MDISTKLEQLRVNLPIIQNTYSDDACLVLTDTDKIIGYRPGHEIDLKLSVGEDMEKYKKSVTYQSLKTGKTLREERGTEVVGVAYISTATPIIEDGNVVGVLAAIVSNQKLDSLRKRVTELTTVTKELSSSSEEMTKVSNVTAAYLQELAEESQLINEDIKQIEQVLDVIKNTALKSQVLGLNASIEGARAGEHGKGFMVVANEIKKMADSSKASIENIEPQLKSMMNAIEKMTATIQEISSQTEEQSAMVEEFHSAYEQIVATAAKLTEQSIV